MAGELTLLQLNALIDAGIKVNGNKEITPPIHNNIEKKIALSSINKKDGGDVEALIRYVSEFVMTDRKHIPFVGYVDDLGMAVLQDAKDYTDQEIGLIPAPDLTALWNLSGNTFDARKKLGSTSGDFGFDFIKANTVHGGLSDTAKWYWGTNAAFADTDHSLKGSGNTSASYALQVQNSDNSHRAWFRNDGLFSASNGYAQGSNVIAQEVSSRVKLGSITDNKGIDFVTGGFTVMSADYADFLTFNGVSGTIFRRNSVEAMRITTDGTNPVIVMSSRFYNNGDSNPTADLFQRKLFRNNGDEALNYSDMQKHNVSPTSPNRTVQVVVNGETIYLHGKTTND